MGAFRVSRNDALAARDALDRLLGAADLDLGLSERFGDDVERYVELLLEANQRLNLTRVVEPGAVARLHLLDALVALPTLDAMAPRSLLDLGSGGGVPGIPLALARPAWSWTLVDSAGRKADALRSFVAALGLDNVDVIAARAEDLGRQTEHREAHDVVTARACAALGVLVEYALPLIRIGGRLVAWKGPLADAELESGRAAAAVLGGGAPVVQALDVAGLGGHRLVIVDKVAATPDAYPRRAGVPSRRPLGPLPRR